jgi:hypothetical protein
LGIKILFQEVEDDCRWIPFLASGRNGFGIPTWEQHIQFEEIPD